jgi:opacity protein-like surface antigen
MKHPSVLPLARTCAATCATAQAADSLGLYIGGAVGQADLHVDRSLTGTLSDVSEHPAGWKAMVGIRPLSSVGAELDYLDFGNPRYASGATPTITTGTVDSKAVALFGVLYVPIPVSFLDVYGKVGVARLRTDVSGMTSGLFCPVSLPNCGTIAVSRTDTDLAYGAGVQFKFAAAAVRVEYERINSSNGSPDMLSLGFTWSL